MRLNHLLILGLAACATTPKSEVPAASEATKEVAAERTVANNILRIFHTSDEHGWFEGRFSPSHDVRYGGVEVLKRFLDEHGFDRDLDVLISSGDSWTGPAISTLLEGEPMVRAMSYLGYRAAAMGNHEFDFGLEVLRRNASNSAFPYLAANMILPKDKPLPVKGHILVDAGGFKLAIIGLIYRETDKVTLATNVEGIEFRDYAESALAEAQLAKDAGAQAAIIVIHDNAAELAPVAKQLHSLGVRAIFGGHIYQPFEMSSDGIAFCVPYDKMREVCSVEIDKDTLEVKLVQRDPIGSRDNDINDPELKRIHNEALEELAQRGKAVLGTIIGPLGRQGASAKNALGQLVTLSWLAQIPDAEVAINNIGALRTSFQPGEIRVQDVIGLMPFNNTIIRVVLNKEQMTEVLAHPQSLATGAELRGGKVYVRGVEMKGEATARVLINDFMYGGGDGYRFKEYDQKPLMLGIPWRQPIYDFLRDRSNAKKAISAANLRQAWEFLNRPPN
jgi:2',3'-cyclic-nucleotide 2'-phosphodiesterase (5'-nucleotidase family)